MSHDLLLDSRLCALLTHIDQAFAFDVRRRGCPCGGRLNVANYPRKARGPAAIENAESWDTRLSLCCAEEGCRRRATPPSARFLGRKVYAGVVVTLACLTGGGRLKDHAKSLRTALGVSGHTVRRWMSWWRRTFVGGELWMRRRGLFMPCPSESELPESLLAAFKGTACEALISLLKFISPVTTGSVHVL